jgi:hypothetical protein
MGFLDKAKQQAKQVAEQAQSKLDEVQQQFNEGQRSGGTTAAGGSAVDYDQHGRPVARDQDKPHGDPLAGTQEPPAPPADKSPTLPAEGGDPEPPHGDPLRESAPKPPTPPSPGSGMTSGDPLAG